MEAKRLQEAYASQIHILIGFEGEWMRSAYGPLIAVRMNLLTRKTLGGIETDLRSNVRRPDGEPFPGLYAAGEAAGFGGGGVHGYNSLEGTFIGGCIFSGRVAGRAMADEVLGESRADSSKLGAKM